MKQVCPWCQTEIVWDEEIGPEESCPHCFNELGDYRTMKVDLEVDEDDKADRAAMGETPAGGGSLLRGPWAMEPGNWDEDEDGEQGEQSRRYREAVREYVEVQVEAPECPECREFMVHAGEQTVAASDFRPVTPIGLKEPFLKPPFTVNVFVCPHCYQVQQKLSLEDRDKLRERFS